MQIELPDDVIQRAKALAVDGQDVAVVVSEALAKLEWERQEVAAVMAGVAAVDRGEHIALEDFDRDFRARHGIRPDA